MSNGGNGKNYKVTMTKSQQIFDLTLVTQRNNECMKEELMMNRY